MKYLYLIMLIGGLSYAQTSTSTVTVGDILIENNLRIGGVNYDIIGSDYKRNLTLYFWKSVGVSHTGMNGGITNFTIANPLYDYNGGPGHTVRIAHGMGVSYTRLTGYKQQVSFGARYWFNPIQTSIHKNTSTLRAYRFHLGLGAGDSIND